ncbi:MAG: SusC/RagA family TonB-linked outer membrane protein [Bacteroidetes bacterium]|nr:SusC/RagA family TonB-linked outer membrane protein [Bacteroidota bacterium]
MTPKRLFKAMLSVAMLFALQVAVAQNKTVSGKVTDGKDGSPVVGASVAAKGTTTGTSTAADGSFQLSVPSNARVLVVSSVGFGTLEVNITDNMNIVLASTGSNLNEVVVVGYGSARKKDQTGAVAQVKAKDFNKGVLTAADQLIQGKVAGVQVVNNSGAPGGGTTVRIRGNASIRSSNQPLFVVDGVPLDGGNARPGLGNNLGGIPGANPLNFINPNDIASMEILKDASAAAIYGSRGANGVILITTKKGQAGTPKIEFNAGVGAASIMKRFEVMDGNEYRSALQKYNQNSGNYGGNVDALNEILQTAITQNYNASVSGGNETGRYRLSVGWLDQQGIIKESGMKRATASLSGSYKFLDSKKLGLDFNLFTAQTREDVAPISNDAGFQGSLIGHALQWNPTHPLRKADGSLWVEPQFGNTSVNPLAMLEAYDDNVNTTEVLASVSPYYRFNNNFEYRMLYSVRRGNGVRKNEIKRFLNLQGNLGSASIGLAEQNTQQLTHTLTYNNQITSDFNLNAVVGYEYMKYDNLSYGMGGSDYTDFPGLSYYNYLQNAPGNRRGIGSGAGPIVELQSYFARAVVNWQDRLVLTGTVRADGSSKFGSNNRYGVFPSFALAWNVSNEKFLANNKFISNLKVRAGWGRTGNQEFPAGASLNRYQINGPNDVTRSNFGNADLTWEQSDMINAGVDFGLFEDRVWGSIDWFQKLSSKVLFEQIVAQPGPPGSAKYWINLPGNILNTGVELAVNAAVVRGKDFSWNVGVNASFLRNELRDFGNQFFETGSLSGQGISGARAQRLASGQPINVFYLRDFQGIDKATGQSIYANDGNKLFYSGNPNPTTLLGFTTDLNYKKFSAVINMNGAFGHVIYNNTLNTVLPIGNLGTRNIAKSLVKDGQALEAISNPIAPSTRYLESGNYLKLANATVSYNVGNLGKTFRNVNISMTGQNLFVVTKFSGFDPEVNVDKQVDGIPSFGIEYIPYPTARTILLGVSFGL